MGTTCSAESPESAGHPHPLMYLSTSDEAQCLGGCVGVRGVGGGDSGGGSGGRSSGGSSSQ